jgi:3-hydroxyisobutyrate dehydrogenase-like beta-hydroxyacid dehydrogenase
MNIEQLAFIGLGVMGEPMCRNLATRSGLPVSAFDLDRAPLQRLAAHGVQAAADVATLVAHCDVLLLSLPSGEVVQQVCEGAGGLLALLRAGQIVIDLGTSPVALTRDLAARCAARGAHFIDAPVARTRAAAEAGTLSVMVGAEPALFERVRPLLATMASDITLCGPVGAGQVVKTLNNMVLFETVAALAEARAIAERAGVDATLLFEAFSKGSADSFALRNHGMKAMLPGHYPERAFSVSYARKDLAYALQLAQGAGVDAPGARCTDALYQRAEAAGWGELYHPVVSRVLSVGGA